jgi:hypothetical protein
MLNLTWAAGGPGQGSRVGVTTLHCDGMCSFRSRKPEPKLDVAGHENFAPARHLGDSDRASLRVCEFERDQNIDRVRQTETKSQNA